MAVVLLRGASPAEEVYVSSKTCGGLKSAQSARVVRTTAPKCPNLLGCTKVTHSCLRNRLSPSFAHSPQRHSLDKGTLQQCKDNQWRRHDNRQAGEEHYLIGVIERAKVPQGQLDRKQRRLLYHN